MFKKQRSKIFLIFLLGIFLAFQSVAALDVGVSDPNVNASIGLRTENPLVVVARIINFALAFLGIIAVILMIYAGFKWMTSNGDDQEIIVAKKILKNTVIGLIIILSSWGITTYIFSRLLGATGNGSIIDNSGGNNNINLGLSALGACSVVSVYPEPGQKEAPRNSSILITFREALASDSVCVDNSGASCACNQTDCRKINPEAIHIYSATLGDACGNNCPSNNTNIKDVSVNLSGDGKTLALTPTQLLGSPTENTWYGVRLGDAIKKTSGISMFDGCQAGYLEWQFEVSSKLDLTPPQINSVFPPVDILADTISSISTAQRAAGSINVLQLPQIDVPATVGTITKSPVGATFSDIDAIVDPGYAGDISIFTVTVIGTGAKAQLLNNNSVIANADFNNNNFNFPGYLSIALKSGNPAPGNSWKINVSPAKAADTLTIGLDVYTFVSGGSGRYSISKKDTLSGQANEIRAVLGGRNDIVVDNSSGSNIVVHAAVAGIAGNEIVLASNNSRVRAVTLTGGTDKVDKAIIKDQPDQPMNSLIQVNFNEVINPMGLAGKASEVYNSIHVVNFNTSAKADAAACSVDSDCMSYNCSNNRCSGNYVDGKFTVSADFKAVEFSAANECGMNGCGDKIYCLPANSHLALHVLPTHLIACQADSDCASKAPYGICSAYNGLDYKTCRDENIMPVPGTGFRGTNYPGSDLSRGYGIADIALNSFDGNSDGKSQGPVSHYYATTKDHRYGDIYSWSFFISAKMEVTAPVVSALSPSLNEANISVEAPIAITFNKLMSVATLKSGASQIIVGDKTIEHHYFNIFSKAAPLGYWIGSENIVSNSQIGIIDNTKVYIRHATLSESGSYSPQIGSGAKDIYQNCYKPSAGPGCASDQLNSSCCYGLATSTLNSAGNCGN